MSVINKHFLPYSAFGVAILLYSTTLATIYKAYFSDPSPYAHGATIFLISLVLIYKRWKSSRNNISVNLSVRGTLLLLTSSALWFVAGLAYIEILQQIFFVFVLVSLLIALFGHDSVKEYYVPLFLLILGLPVWYIFVPFFQSATASGTLFLLKLFGVTSYSEGIYIFIPEGSFKIATLCAGMRYQVAAIILSIAYLHWYKISFFVYPVVVIAASAVAFIANLLRVFLVILSGHLTNMQHYFVTTDHVSLGWVLFAITIFIFFYLLSHAYNKIIVDREQYSNNKEVAISVKKVRQANLYFVIMISLISGPALLYIYNSHPPLSEPRVLSQINIDKWQFVSEDLENRSPVWKKGDMYYTGVYKDGDLNRVDLFISRFSYQSEGREAVSVANKLYDPYEWEASSTNVRKIRLESDITIDINETVVIENLRLKNKSHESAESRIIWSWYQVGERIVATPINAKLWNLVEKIRGYPEITTVIISTEFNDNHTVSRELLKDFASKVLDHSRQHTKS